MQRVLAVVLDDDAQHAGALVGVGVRLHRQHSTADAGVDRRTDKARLFADQLADLHIVAGLHHRGGGSADVHRQGDDHGVRLREPLDRQMLGELLVLRGMDAAVKAFIAPCTSLGHVGLDLLHTGQRVVPQLNGLLQELLRPALLLKALIDVFPRAVLLGVDLALAVLGAAALAVHQALGAVRDGADTAGGVQIALGAGTAGLFRQRHAVMTHIVQGIGGGKRGHLRKVGHRLHAQTAGDDHHVIRPRGDDPGQLLFGLHLVAQEVHLHRARDVLALFGGEGGKAAALRLLGGVKLLEALVAGNDKEIVLSCHHAVKLFRAFQRILGIIQKISPSYSCS